jgi:two-component system cell cycle sensor histidine kinase/response regulator CckA
VETSIDNYRVHQEKDKAEKEKQQAQEALRRTEEQLRQAQKMEAVGRLAGGVAHDFNNLLTIIKGYSELLLTSLPFEDPSRGFIEEIKKAGDRASALTQQLLAFSRKHVPKPASLDLNTVVSDMEKMLGRLIGETIELVTIQAPDLRSVTDLSQMGQVIMNLAVNARDAMPGGGRIAIETSNVDLDSAYLPTAMDYQPGSYVLLKVSDTGRGMDEATLAHIFEPFFTTKEPGKGTGLGLATVYGIVKQCGGHILVNSVLGEGTTFKIYLPQAGAEPAGEQPTVVLPPIPCGNRTILLAEDEEGVRKIAHYVLQMSGYQVLVAQDGREALEIAEKHADPIHLLVTDTVMPHMGGRELAKRLQPVHPEARVLFMSGYTDDAVGSDDGAPPPGLFLQKPFTPQALVVKIHEAFGSIHPI